MRRDAEAALARLEEIAEIGGVADRHQALLRVAEDEQLDHLLDPLRQSPPRKVICGKCRRKLMFLGLRMSTPRVFFQNHGPTPATGNGQRGPGGEPLPAPFNQWSISPIWGGVDDPAPVDPGAAPGEALRFRFECHNPQCKAPYTLTNTGMLRRLLLAIAHSEKRIRL